MALQSPTHWLMLLSTDNTNEAVKARVYFSSHPFSQKYLTKTSGCHRKIKLFISLEQNKPAFSLLSKSPGVNYDSYKIEILNCDLYMKILEMVDKEI